MTTETAFEGWAIVELMGHRRLAGFLREAQIGGAAFIRLDVPETDDAPAATQFYSPTAVYCITPTTEEMARAVARTNRIEVVQRWELRAIEGPTPVRTWDDDRDDVVDPQALPFG